MQAFSGRMVGLVAGLVIGAVLSRLVGPALGIPWWAMDAFLVALGVSILGYWAIRQRRARRSA